MKYLYFANPDDDVFLCAGALDILRERKGDNYVSEITGLRGPKNWQERITCFFTGKLFEYKSA